MHNKHRLLIKKEHKCNNRFSNNNNCHNKISLMLKELRLLIKKELKFRQIKLINLCNNNRFHNSKCSNKGFNNQYKDNNNNKFRMEDYLDQLKIMLVICLEIMIKVMLLNFNIYKYVNLMMMMI
jgi:hypothetical protein